MEKQIDEKLANASLTSPFFSLVNIPPWLPYQLIKCRILLNLFHLQLSHSACSLLSEG